MDAYPAEHREPSTAAPAAAPPAADGESGDGPTLTPEQMRLLHCRLEALDRPALIDEFRRLRCRFPVDFTDDWFRRQSDDQLRPVLEGLCLHCREIPRLARRDIFAA